MLEMVHSRLVSGAQSWKVRLDMGTQNVMNRVKRARAEVASERGEWLGSLAWTAIYGIGAIAVALAIGVALTSLGGRVGSSLDNVTG